ncbi:zinc finger and BTB domain-containing protein 14 isoform X2 [Anabrus simplex]|uniref:zinc finger and BTB domain-containing protein 14 isoform X2 n=1 Tax=Anabrus simplex TaxID=316456 RepID=UPI0034DDA3CA
MEELVFIKCEPKWPSDTEEGLSNFGQNTFPTSDCQVKIKEDPRAIDADLSLEEVDVKIDMEEVDIKMDKEPCSDEDGVGDAHDEGCDNTGGSSHDVENFSLLIRGTEHVCNSCQKVFNQTIDLKRHMLTHTGERPYTCTICNSTFTQQGHLKTHLLTHSGARPFSCSFCGNSFRRSSHLRRHQNIHIRCKCLACEFVCK